VGNTCKISDTYLNRVRELGVLVVEEVGAGERVDDDVAGLGAQEVFLKVDLKNQFRS
jgi:hypothetical protein